MCFSLTNHPLFTQVSFTVRFADGTYFVKGLKNSTYGYITRKPVDEVEIRVYDDFKLCPSRIVHVFQDVGVDVDENDIQIYKFRKNDGQLDDGYSINDFLI